MIFFYSGDGSFSAKNPSNPENYFGHKATLMLTYASMYAAKKTDGRFRTLRKVRRENKAKR